MTAFPGGAQPHHDQTLPLPQASLKYRPRTIRAALAALRSVTTWGALREPRPFGDDAEAGRGTARQSTRSGPCRIQPLICEYARAQSPRTKTSVLVDCRVALLLAVTLLLTTAENGGWDASTIAGSPGPSAAKTLLSTAPCSVAAHTSVSEQPAKRARHCEEWLTR